MLPVTQSFNELMFPMTASVYYAEMEQGDLGEMTRTWVLDRVIKCSAIKENVRSSNFMVGEQFLDLKIRIKFRSAENPYDSDAQILHRPTEVIITDITDPSGQLVWREDSVTATVFEIETVEPVMNENHNATSWKSILTRSDDQVLR